MKTPRRLKHTVKVWKDADFEYFLLQEDNRETIIGDGELDVYENQPRLSEEEMIANDWVLMPK